MAKSSLTLTLGNIPVRQLDGLFSLNDLHKAAGGEKRHQPSDFLRIEQTQALIAEIHSTDSQSASSADSRSLAFKTVVGKGKAQGTYACRELVIAYAAWINAAFHLKVIRVFLDSVQSAPAARPALDYTRITPAQAQHLRELVQLVAESGKQTHGETWNRLHRKMKVNSYLELSVSRFDEARHYLAGKMDDTSMAALIQKHFPGGVLAALQVQALPQYKPLEPGKLIVDRAKLAAVWVDLGRLRQRLVGLGVMESDLPPEWWHQHAISAN